MGPGSGESRRSTGSRPGVAAVEAAECRADGAARLPAAVAAAGRGTHLARDVVVPGGFLVVTLALTLAGTVRKRRRSLTELKPQLAL